MLSGASFLSYQTAPLKSIRDAIQDDEHHIVRVNEEGTGEIYDLNLSHSKPYASPVQRSIAAQRQRQQQHDEQQDAAGPSAAAGPSSAANRQERVLPGLSYVSGAGNKQNGNDGLPTRSGLAPPWPLGPTRASRASSEAPKPAAPNGDAAPQSASVNTGPRILKLPHVVSRRHLLGLGAVDTGKGQQSGATATTETEPEMTEKQRSDDAAPVDFSKNMQSGEFPPSPPLEADEKVYPTVNGAADTSASTADGDTSTSTTRSDAATITTTNFKERPPKRPMRRSTTDDPTSIRRPLNVAKRDTSVTSASSSAYLTASSHEDLEEDGRAESRSSFVAEPSSYLHPSSAAHHEPGSPTSDGPRKFPPPSGAPYAYPPLRMPPRRNTTGAASLGGASPSRRSRRGSLGSQTSQRELRTSEDRHDMQSPQGAQSPRDETSSGVGSPQPDKGAPLRTGDAGFDEVVAKQYDQIRRERESKKKREAQGKPGDKEPQAQQGQTSHDAPHAKSGHMHLQRARSRRGTEEEGPKAMIGNVISEGHVNFVLMYNMLTGIRIGVSRCQAKMRRPLTDADYMAKHKFTFDIVGNELTPEAKYDFKFKDYAPWVFRELREHFHLDAADYLFSLTAKYILSELGSPGKSGSFFYFSRDYRFIIKTIRHNEHKFLRRILKDYHLHIKENPHTLLSRFYGLHRVKLPGGKKIHFVIMNNLFPPHKDIHETYDLKGSAIGREYSEEKAAQKKGAVLKDLNWIKRGRELELGPAKRALFEAQVRSDVALLQRLGIMDYSLLIGLHDMKRGNKEGLRQDALQVVQPESQPQANITQNGQIGGLRRQPTTRMEKEAYALRAAVRRSDAKALGSSSAARLPERETSDRHHLIFYQDEGGFRSTDEENRNSDWIYYFGIIDTLTLYSGVKRSEHYWKSIANNSRMISAIHPVPYGQRFCNFLFSLVKGADTSMRPRMQ